MRVVALIAAYNEADVIRQTLDELLAQEIEVFLLDNGSTDDTARIAAERLGRGVLAIERFPPAGGSSDRFPWSEILRRKESLAAELDADWFLHQDADELRESPWLQRSFRQGLELVDALGYNAVDFEVLDFRPIDDSFVAGADLRAVFSHFERAESWDRVQVKAWRKQPSVDLASTGGHEAVFPGRRVFPVRFLSRHYPIRSRAHGERKVFAERLPRFQVDERERGWHRQYDRYGGSQPFVWRSDELEPFDAERVRVELAIRNREWEAAAGTPLARDAELLETLRARDGFARELDRRNREVARLSGDLDARNRELARVHGDLDQRNREVARASAELDLQYKEVTRLSGALDGRNREVDRFGAELDRQNLEAARLGGELDLQNREVVRLSAELDRQNLEAVRLGGELDLRNREVVRLGGELDLRNREVVRLSEALDRQNREVARLSVELDGRNREASRMQGEAEQQRLEAERLRAELDHRTRELDRRGEEIERGRSELTTVTAERARLAVELERLLSSRTWRWSRPLRDAYWRARSLLDGSRRRGS